MITVTGFFADREQVEQLVTQVEALEVAGAQELNCATWNAFDIAIGDKF